MNFQEPAHGELKYTGSCLNEPAIPKEEQFIPLMETVIIILYLGLKIKILTCDVIFGSISRS